MRFTNPTKFTEFNSDYITYMQIGKSKLEKQQGLLRVYKKNTKLSLINDFRRALSIPLLLTSSAQSPPDPA